MFFMLLGHKYYFIEQYKADILALNKRIKNKQYKKIIEYK